MFRDIAARVEQHALGRQSIAARATRLLVVAFDVLRQIGVSNKSHIRFVDAHAKRDRCAHDSHFVTQKRLLIPRAIFGIEPRVIRHRRMTSSRQRLGEQFSCLARLAIHNPRIGRHARGNLDDLLGSSILATRLGLNAIHQIRSIEAREKHLRIAQAQLSHNVIAHALSCCRRERNDGRVRKRVARRSDLAILRAKVMTPFADAVRFIDCKRFDIPTAQLREKIAIDEPFRCDIENAILAVVELRFTLTQLRAIKRRVEKGRRNTRSLHLIDLIFHQRNQRRSNHGQSTASERRKLIAQTLARACWKNCQHIVARQRCFHNLALQRTECVVAEDSLEVVREESVRGCWRKRHRARFEKNASA